MRTVIFVIGMIVFAGGAGPALGSELGLQSLFGSVPAAKPNPDDARHEALCRSESRDVESAEDKAVVDAGWILYSSARRVDSTRVFVAAPSLDGQCRPQNMAAFVFRGGKAVGMITPRDARALPLLQLDDASTLIVKVDYRKPGDAGCCPTGKATLAVKISDQGIAGQ